jgi:3',5'-nucleoside bisphosphate phosphatase
MEPAHVEPDFDLQSHSIESDGALAPADVVAHAAAAGMRLIALTDHDTVDGVAEALRAARDHGLRCSPAAELSSVSGEFEDLHVCGYELRHDDAILRATLADFRADRGRRIWAMADRLEQLGFALDRSELRARERAGAPLGRPHLADAVLAHPANAAKLRAEGIDGKDTLFPPYLVPGAVAYVARSRPTVEEAIEVIHAAGGVAVWAHPFWDIAARETVLAALDRFAAAGLDGVEVFYPAHDEEQTRMLHGAAVERGLLATGSADFHGPGHDRFSRFGAFSLYGLEPRLGPIGAQSTRRPVSATE